MQSCPAVMEPATSRVVRRPGIVYRNDVTEFLDEFWKQVEAVKLEADASNQEAEVNDHYNDLVEGLDILMDGN